MSAVSLKFLSLNIWHGGARWVPLVKFLRAQAADIFLLQEARHRQEVDLPPAQRTVSALKALWPDYHFYFAPMFGDLTVEYGLVPSGNLLISRYPLRTTRHLYPDRPYGEWADAEGTPATWMEYPSLLQVAHVETPLGRWQVINLHGPVNYDGDLPCKRRQALVRELIRLFEQGERLRLPTVALGDSNAKWSNSVWEPLATCAQLILPAGVKTSFNMKRKTQLGYATAAVDLGWASPELRLESVTMPAVDVSDHLPLVVELSL